jgi:hypothetical protein
VFEHLKQLWMGHPLLIIGQKNQPTMVASGFCPQHRLQAGGAQTTHTDLIHISWLNIFTLSFGILHVGVEKYGIIDTG